MADRADSEEGSQVFNRRSRLAVTPKPFNRAISFGSEKLKWREKQKLVVSQHFICLGASTCGVATCRVHDSRNDCVRRKAIRGHGAPPLWRGLALIAHPRRIISKRHPAYVMPSRATLPMNRLLRGSCETESLYGLVVQPFRKAPTLGSSSVPHERSIIQEMKCS